MTDDLVEKVHENIGETRRFTTSELSFEFLRISRSLLHEIVKKKLAYHKFCLRWVPKLSTEERKKQQIAVSLTFLEVYNKDGDSLLDRVATLWMRHGYNVSIMGTKNSQ